MAALGTAASTIVKCIAYLSVSTGIVFGADKLIDLGSHDYDQFYKSKPANWNYCIITKVEASKSCEEPKHQIRIGTTARKSVGRISAVERERESQ